MKYTNEIDDLLGKYFSREISDDEFLKLKEWLSENEEHRLYFSGMENIWDAAHPAFVRENISTENALKKAHTHIQRHVSRTITWLRYWQQAAAVLILPLAGILLYLLTATEPSPEIAYQKIYNPYGIRSEVKLPDGSTVWLNGGSTLKYPVQFTDNVRDVFLTGEGFFEVTADPANPFVVYTAATRVKAVGTAFNVEAYDGDTLTAVTMAEGKIEFYFAEGRAPFAMRAGQRVEYNALTTAANITSVEEPYRWYAWKDGTLMFRDDPLETVVKRISRIYNVDIVVKDKDLAQYPYRATFRNKSLSEILELLKISAPLNYNEKERIADDSDVFGKRTIEIVKIK